MKTMISLYTVVLVMLGGSAQALERMVPYDNFNPSKPNPYRATRIRGIDPARWSSEQTGTRLASVRELAFTRLRLMSRSDTGAGLFGLRFTNSDAVTAMQAMVRLNNAKTVGCSTRGYTTAEGAAELTGRFFNAGTPSRGSALDDISASIRIVSRSTDAPGSKELRVVAVIERCVDASCQARTALFTQELGLVHEGGEARLRVQWDPDNQRFIFQRDDQPEVHGYYTVSAVSPPGSPLKAMAVTHALPACPSTAPKPLGLINAYIHDVFVNESAAP